MFIPILSSLIFIISFTKAVNLNNNNEFTLLLSVYGYGICTVKIDENQESDQNFNLILETSSGIKSIDLSYNENKILWLENDAIKAAYFHFEHDTQINVDKINIIIESGVFAFSLDWISGNVYYYKGRQIIAVNSTNPNNFRVIINETKENFGDLKVDPTRGHLYWSQWDSYGNKAQIMRANLDGTNQTDISKMGYLKSPISLAADFVRQKIYFIDNVLFKIGSIDKRGNFRIFTQDRDLTQYSRSSDFFRNDLYWNFAKSVYSNHIYLNHFNLKYLRKPIRPQRYIDSIKILDSSRQPFAINRCYNNNCSYLCIPSGSHNYRCVCPQIDNITSKTYCKESINELLNSSQTDWQQFLTIPELNEYIAYYDKKLSTHSVIIILIFVFVIGNSIALITLYITHIHRRHICEENDEQLENNETEEHLTLNLSDEDSA